MSRALLPLTMLTLALLLPAQQAAGQALSYDLYYVLPGEEGTGGVDMGFATPSVADVGDLNDLDVMAKYAVADGVELGALARFGFLRSGGDALSAMTIGAKYSLADYTAMSFNVTPHNERDETGVSMGLMNSWIVRDIGVNSQLLVGWLDGYSHNGAMVDVLVEPVLPLNDRTFAYLDVMLRTHADKPADRLGITLGPNVDYELSDGLVANLGIQFSVYSGDLILQDTDFGLVVSLFKTAMLW